MFNVMKKLAVALVAGLCLTVTGSFAHGDHGDKASKCCKTVPGAQLCDTAKSGKACPAETATMADCCKKTAAGDKQECCAKHLAGNRQPCCEKVAAAPAACCKDKAAAAPAAAACCKDKAAAVAAAPAGSCCKVSGGAATADHGQLSPSMQNLMQKVDELRHRRQ